MRARRTPIALAATLGLATALAAATAPSTRPAASPTAADRAHVTVPQPAEVFGAPEEPGDALLRQRGPVSARDYQRAMRQADQVLHETATEMPGAAASDWTMIGPTNIGGRVLDVVADPQLPDTVYAAAASGGVWVSTDRARTFRSIWPDHYTQAIGALEMTSDGVLYAGTGEAGPGGGSITYGGNGIYRSKDRGKTWQHIGLAESGRIGRILIDPSDQKRVFVAAVGDLYEAGGERGVYRSSDGGDTWELVLEGDNATTGASDLSIDPENPQNVLATMWDNRREPDRRAYTGLGSGIYRSTDGGDTWTRVGLPYFAPSPTLGRIGIAYAPSDPDRVYAISTTEIGAFAGFYVSDDGGVTYTPRAGVPLVTGAFVYGWWFGRLYVNPRDANHVFAPGVNLAMSTNGGTSWGSSGGTHADQHGMDWDPHVEGRVYLGDDGGVWVSEEDGANWEKSQYQPFNQLYGIDVDAKDERRIVAGLQDNGAVRSWEPDGTIEAESWNDYVGGDGEQTVIHPEDGEIVYGCYQYGACSVSYDGGNRMEGFENDIVASRKNWFTPIVLDPLVPSTAYTGGESLWRSEDDGRTWTRIGGATVDFSNGPGRELNPLFRNYGTITSIAVTDRDFGRIVVGTDDGNVWVSDNDGVTFRKVGTGTLPKAWVTRVAVDLAQPDTIYATFSGYRQADDHAHVWRSTDFGATWAEIGSNLPDAPVNDVIVVGDDLFVATDVGVFWSRDDGQKWYAVGTNLPRAPVNDIKYHAKTNRIYAATFGRGAYWATYPKASAGGPTTTPPTVTPPKPVPPRAKPLPATGLPGALPMAALLCAGVAAVLLRRTTRRG